MSDENIYMEIQPVEYLATGPAPGFGMVMTVRLNPEDNFFAHNLLITQADGERLLGDLLLALVQERSDVDRLLGDTIRRCSGPLGGRVKKR